MFLRSTLLACLALALVAAEGPVERLTLTDGRTLVGVYDDEAQTLTLVGKMKAVLNIPVATIAKREPAQDAAPAAGPATTLPALGGGGPGPEAFAAAIADTVPWADGDRVLFVGDLLCQPGKEELADLLHRALSGAGKRVSVFGIQNSVLPSEQWLEPAKAEIARRPPQVVVVVAGAGEVLAKLPDQPPPGQPIPEIPAQLDVPTVEVFAQRLEDLVDTAQKAGAAVILCTPAVVGDKPSGGPGAEILAAYSRAIHGIAAAKQATVCDLRGELMGRLLDKNPKSVRDLGILSRWFGQLKPEAIDLCARSLGTALAEAVPRIPWTVRVKEDAFTDRGELAIETPRRAPGQVQVRYSTDGREAGPQSPLYTGPVSLSESAFVRVHAIAGEEHREARGWVLHAPKLGAVRAPEASLPGLAVDHFSEADWTQVHPVATTAAADWSAWYPNVESDLLDALGTARPAQIPCLRWQGWIVVPETDRYVFALTSTGDARLVIDDQTVVDLKRSALSDQARGARTLEAGWHRLACYLHSEGAEVSLSLRAAVAGQRLRPVPDLLLRREAGDRPSVASLAPPAADAPWTIVCPGGAFRDNVRIALDTKGIAAASVQLSYTTDGTEPTEASERYTREIPISNTTRLRVLGINPTDNSRATADVWYTELKDHTADGLPSTTKPGLWVEHLTLDQWTDPISGIDKRRPDFVAAWPNVEFSAFTQVPVHRFPNTLFGMRFTGFFFAPVEGDYTFAVNSDDASRIIMGIVHVLRNDDLHPDRLQVESVHLTAGWHQLNIPYGQGPGVIALGVRVGLDGQRLQPLGDLLLRRDATPPETGGIRFGMD